MATITDTQLQFSSNNISTGDYHFPTGTVSLFFLSSAPSEWSQVTSQNNKAFRVVSGSGGGTGGSNSFTGCFASRNLGANFNCTINSSNIGSTSISSPTMAQHSHGINNGGGINVGSDTPNTPGTNVRQGNGATGNYGNSGSHNHPHSTSASGSFNTSLNFAVQYVDVILCSYSGT
jgi:hypothetical protein